MIRNLKVVAIIPARGGSKGLPGKNIIDLCGKPLIVYTIEAALNSKYIDRVIVTTDSEKIAQISKNAGAEAPFIRPKYLAKDTTHTPPVIKHAVRFIERQGDHVDFVVTLQPTSPLRRTEQIDEAIELLCRSRFKSVISVKPASYPPYWIVKVKRDQAVPFIDDGVDYFRKERQQLPKTYQLNGAIYVTRREILFKKMVIITKRCGVIVMDEKTSLDVDTYDDLKRIERVIRQESILKWKEGDLR